MTYDANNTDGVSAFADIVEANFTHDLAMFLIDGGLMIPQGPEIDMMVHMTQHPKSKVWEIMTAFDPTIYDDFVSCTINHIRGGEDTEDADSVGGFSQREIDLVCDYISKRQQ